MDTEELLAPMVGTVIRIDVRPGDEVRAGQQVVVLESMKMEHIVRAPAAGVVARVDVTPGDAVKQDQPLLALDMVDPVGSEPVVEPVDLDGCARTWPRSCAGTRSGWTVLSPPPSALRAAGAQGPPPAYRSG